MFKNISYDIKNFKNIYFCIVCRKFDVYFFGLWRNLIFKVFVLKKIDEENLKFELMRINELFFLKYFLDVEKKKIVEMLIMK